MCKKQGIFAYIQYYKGNIKNTAIGRYKIGWFEPLDLYVKLWYYSLLRKLFFEVGKVE